MRTAVWLVIARCAAARAPVALDGRVASCGGERIALPASMAIVRADARAVIAASPTEAVIVARDDAPPGDDDRAWLVDETSDATRLVDRYVLRYAHGCAFAAVANAPVTAGGGALITAIAGPRAETWLVGSSRVPDAPALTRLCAQTAISCSSASHP